MALIQFFDNEQDREARDGVRKLEDAGFRVTFLPSSGAAILSIEEYEIVGGAAIQNAAERITRYCQ